MNYPDPCEECGQELVYTCGCLTEEEAGRIKRIAELEAKVERLKSLCREVVEAKGDRTGWHIGCKLSDTIDKLRKEVGKMVYVREVRK